MISSLVQTDAQGNVYGRIQNYDEKLASSTVTTVQNPYHCETKMGKMDTLFLTKTAKKHGTAHTYVAHMREYPLSRACPTVAVFEICINISTPNDNYRAFVLVYNKLFC